MHDAGDLPLTVDIAADVQFAHAHDVRAEAGGNGMAAPSAGRPGQGPGASANSRVSSFVFGPQVWWRQASARHAHACTAGQSCGMILSSVTECGGMRRWCLPGLPVFRCG
ncbi:hypothetical protein [Streptomyces sp. NPDC001851]|uniref:hypothetical protein n=1 Tax=Streptomyces sp. NPDC001851 TaxID=3154529 RepID=UPI003323886D